MELSCKRDAHFGKMSFFGTVGFFLEFWCRKASENEAKIHEKIAEKRMEFSIEKRSSFSGERGRKRSPKGVDLGSEKEEQKRGEKRGGPRLGAGGGGAARGGGGKPLLGLMFLYYRYLVLSRHHAP